MAKAPSNRQRRGAAWYWKQTDSWYYTPTGSKRRVGLFDEHGKRIRGKSSKQAAELALARVQVAAGFKLAPLRDATVSEAPRTWLVAKVCSEYLQYCERRVSTGNMSRDHRQSAVHYLNEFAGYCGALPTAELKRGQVTSWIESHMSWRSPATRRNVIAIILAAFNLAEREYQVRNPLKGLKKPPPQPKLISFSVADEKAIYTATDEPYRDFLFAAIHTGLRPFCELAKLTAEHVEEVPRGMLWRVYSTKTKKTRKIPVRPEVAELTRKRMLNAPKQSGVPLFANPQNRPWKKVTGVMRFMAIRRKLGWNTDPARKRYSTYVCRHTFAHRMLSGFWNGGAGCSIEVLAELMGDTPKVAFDHYGREWGQHYQDPLWAAIE
ncbi:MAG: tyrosine-type recombinase/integrase [Planctomycetaceae bacterium]|nr:tyrosine-type recombinase/integrase [Planctomycetaceae bacterium]